MGITPTGDWEALNPVPEEEWGPVAGAPQDDFDAFGTASVRNIVNTYVTPGHSHDGSGTNTTVVGDSVTASVDSAISVGDNASVTGTESIGIGRSISITVGQAVGLGEGVSVTGASGNIVIGDDSSDGGFAAIVVGASISANGTGIYIGTDVGGTRVVSVGLLQTGNSGADDGVIVGHNADGGDAGTSDRYVAVGQNAGALKADTVAIGDTARATAASATAVGSTTTATAITALALGAFADATHADGVALGADCETTAANQVQIEDRHIEMFEIADPGNGGVNTGRLYVRDNGAGKTQLVVVFNTGAVQVIATEP